MSSPSHLLPTTHEPVWHSGTNLDARFASLDDENVKECTDPRDKKKRSGRNASRSKTDVVVDDEEALAVVRAFNARYHRTQDDTSDARALTTDIKQRGRRYVRRQQLLKKRIREAKMMALLPEPWKLANPGPIGLLGFGLTTILMGMVNSKIQPLSTVVPACALINGAGLHGIAGLLEFCRGNTFSCITFLSYCGFWLSMFCNWYLPTIETSGILSIVHASTAYALGVYLVIWGIFSSVIFFCTLRANLGICLMFLSITLQLFTLGGSAMAENEFGGFVGGIIGIVSGGLALYMAFAEILNEVWDHTILPVVPFTQVFGWLNCKGQEGENTSLTDAVGQDNGGQVRKDGSDGSSNSSNPPAAHKEAEATNGKRAEV